MPHLPASLPGHDGHDPLAIAAYAAGDATGPELDDALALVAACPGCAALHHDLRAIAAALPALPAPVRPRDYRLTPGQAASLRPAGWRRLLAPLAGPRFAFAGPLGTGLATLGIAGLLVAGSFGTRLAGPAATGSAAGAPAPEASAAPVPKATAIDRAAVRLAPPMTAVPGAAQVGDTGNAGGTPERGVVVPGGEPGEGAPDTEGSVTYTGSGTVSGVQPAASGDPEAFPPLEFGTSSTSGDDLAVVQAEDAPAPVANPNAALAALAGLLLTVGIALAGLRFLARRGA